MYAMPFSMRTEDALPAITKTGCVFLVRPDVGTLQTMLSTRWHLPLKWSEMTGLPAFWEAGLFMCRKKDLGFSMLALPDMKRAGLEAGPLRFRFPRGPS